jgi:uncharacterized protein YuzE
MIDMTYDPKADAVYIQLARGGVDRTEEAGPFIYDVDVEGRICGIEILSASKVLGHLGLGSKRGGLAQKAPMLPSSAAGDSKASQFI